MPTASTVHGGPLRKGDTIQIHVDVLVLRDIDQFDYAFSTEGQVDRVSLAALSLDVIPKQKR